MAKRRKRIQIHLYSKGTRKPESYNISLKVIGGWLLGFAVIVIGFVFWLPDNMINLKNFRVFEIVKEQKAMQLTANKLEKQILEADIQVESGKNLREKVNLLAGINENSQDTVEEKTVADFAQIKNTLQTFEKFRDAILKDESYANSLPILHPTKNHKNITNRFGMIQDPLTKRELPHRGLDFAVSEGDTVIATGDGVVESIMNRKSGFGNTLEIAHTPNIKTVYSHLQSILIGAGKSVKKGQPIAIAGRSGSVLWPVLHYEVRYDDHPINPEDYFITP